MQIYNRLGAADEYYRYLGADTFSQNNLLIVGCALFLFLSFQNMRIGQHKIINSIASTTFGVYLLHDHPFVRDTLWKEWVYKPELLYSLKLIPYSIAVVIAVFAVCSIMEWVRLHTIERLYAR